LKKVATDASFLNPHHQREVVRRVAVSAANPTIGAAGIGASDFANLAKTRGIGNGVGY
jgi:hypothetical protein